MHIPSTVSFGVAFFNISIELVSQVLSCTISLFPALDPLPSLFIIKNYRIAIYGIERQFIRAQFTVLDICRRLFNWITCQGKQPKVLFVGSKTDMKIAQKSKISVFWSSFQFELITDVVNTPTVCIFLIFFVFPILISHFRNSMLQMNTIILKVAFWHVHEQEFAHGSKTWSMLAEKEVVQKIFQFSDMPGIIFRP